MARTLRGVVYPQCSPPDPVRVARPEHLLPEDQWPTNTFSFCTSVVVTANRVDTSSD